MPQPATVLALRLGPVSDDQSVDLISQVQSQLVQLARQRGGADHVMVGNSALILFLGNDQKRQAVQAALDIRLALREHNRHFRGENGRLLSVTQGLGDGNVFTPKNGRPNDVLWDYYGRPVDRAMELRDLAGPGQILLDQSLQREVRRCFVLEDLPLERLLPDMPQRNLYRVLGMREAPLEADALVYGTDIALRAALVGRNTELTLLQQRLSALVEQQGGYISVVGAAGLGKSRLLAELRKWVAGRGWLYEADPLVVGTTPRLLWLESRGLPFHSGREHSNGGQPGILLVPLVLSCLRISESSPVALMGAAGWQRLYEAIEQRWPDRLADIAPYLGHLLGLPIQDKALADRLLYLDAADLRYHTCQALHFLLEKTAGQRPLLIALDDLHWADHYSLTLLSELVPLSSRLPILWIGTSVSRGAEHPTFRFLRQMRSKLSGSLWLNLSLDPLTDRESTNLVQLLLQDFDLPDAYLERVHSRAGGNPFVIEETLHFLIGQRALSLEDGIWQIAPRENEQKSFPSPAGSVEALLQQRLALLSEPVQRTAQVAAIIGRFFTIPVLGQLLPFFTLDQLQAHLDVLEEVSIIRCRGGVEYAFHHILTQDAIYHSLDPQEVQSLHAKVAEVYSQLYTNAPAEGYELLAYHYGQSNEVGKGLHYAQLAGEKNRLRNGFQAARRYFVQAQALAEQLGDEAIAIDMVMAQADVKQQLGDLPAAIAGYRVALERAKARQDFAHQIQANRQLAYLMYLQGDRTSTLRFARRAHELALQFQPDDPAAGSWLHLGLAHLVRCECREAIHSFEQAFAQADTAGDDQGRAASREHLGYIYMLLEHGERALIQYRDHLHWARHIGDRQLEVVALANLAAAYLLCGRMDQAEAAILDSFQVAQLIGLTDTAQSLFQLGKLQYARELWSEAWHTAGRARKLLEKAGRSTTLGLVQRLQAQIVVAAQAEGIGLSGAEEPSVYFRASLQTLRVIQELEWARTLQFFGQYLELDGRQAEGSKYLVQAQGVFERLGIDQLLYDLNVA